MITLSHVALWVRDLEQSKDFYVRYFDGRASEKYRNPRTEFESYFIRFGDQTRLEIMTSPSHPPIGSGHIAFSIGSEEGVNALTEHMRGNGVRIQREPRITGDGYYESVVLDPDGNEIELTR